MAQMPASSQVPAPPDSPGAVIFDLDGVLTDTTELHFQSWIGVAAELGVPIDRGTYDRMRGLGRGESLEVLLAGRAGRLTEAEKLVLTERKNDEYLRLVARMGPGDLLPGAADLLRGLRAVGAAVGVASSSRNADAVIARLGIAPLLDAVVDANTAPRSKPDPLVFQVAAERLGVPASRCVVVEDAAAGIAAARAAGMRVIGIGPVERVGAADAVVTTLAALTVADVLGWMRRSDGPVGG